MKVICFGSRSWVEPHVILKRLNHLPPGTTVVHGKSPGGGADYFIYVYAAKLGHTVIPVPINESDRRRAQAMSRPKFAPLARNERMGAEHADADLAIGFWDGKSHGSKHMKSVCERHGIPVEIIYPTSG